MTFLSEGDSTEACFALTYTPLPKESNHVENDAFSENWKYYCLKRSTFPTKQVNI